MPPTLAIDKYERPEGTTHSGAVSVPTDADTVYAYIDRSSLADDKIAISVQLFISFDSGVSWHPLCQFGTVGGEITVGASVIPETESGINIKNGF